MIKNIKMLLLVSLTFVACTTKEDEVIVDNNSSDNLPLTAGTANFSKYVALGNSLTAGFSDNALFIEGQKTSWTNILAQQFKLVGGGEFKIPFMSDNIGGFAGGDPRFGPRLFFNGTGPQPVSGTPSTNPSTILTGPFNNMGVPGAKSFHLVTPGYGSPLGNPYFARFASNPYKTVLEDAMIQDPTFFSLWIGNNDVLGYATAGGVTNVQDPVFGGFITPVNGVSGVGFDGTYEKLVTELTSKGAKGVVANIPYVNSIPFFTTVLFNPLQLAQPNVDALNAGYAQYNVGLAAAKTAGIITEEEKNLRTIVFKLLDDAGKPFNNPVVIVDEYLTPITLGPGVVLPNYRQATKSDYLVLSSNGTALTKPFFQAGNGSGIPLADRFVLSKSEVLELKTATDAYNVIIKTLAEAKGLAFVDANKILSDVANFGISANGYTVTSAYVTGGGFSMDGVHPSPRGYALIANEFIKAINSKYGSNLKGVNLADYRVQFGQVIQN